MQNTPLEWLWARSCAEAVERDLLVVYTVIDIGVYMYLCSYIYLLQEAFDWGQVDKTALAKCLLALCRQCKESLKEEPRLLRLKSPTYILGELVK